jgi:hypothetical protein
MVHADTDRHVFIRGKIGNTFNENEVKVIDSLNQIYFLSPKLFPKGFNFKQGASFAIEVPENELSQISLKKR